jgi:hypothetical protein
MSTKRKISPAERQLQFERWRARADYVIRVGELLLADVHDGNLYVSSCLRGGRQTLCFAWFPSSAREVGLVHVASAEDLRDALKHYGFRTDAFSDTELAELYVPLHTYANRLLGGHPERKA